MKDILAEITFCGYFNGRYHYETMFISQYLYPLYVTPGRRVIFEKLMALYTI
jgi:hypothetical protein